jgi:hypothetical protein
MRQIAISLSVVLFWVVICNELPYYILVEVHIFSEISETKIKFRKAWAYNSVICHNSLTKFEKESENNASKKSPFLVSPPPSKKRGQRIRFFSSA